MLLVNKERLYFFGRPFLKWFALYYRTIVLSVCPVCNVSALWPNDWMDNNNLICRAPECQRLQRCWDQDETWHAGRPRPQTHCVRWGPSSPAPKGAQPV